MVKYDNLLKSIFFDAVPSLLRVLHCGPIAEYLNIEFPARPKMVADVVARLTDGRILHMEFQLTNDPRMHWRCYHYFGAIQEQWEDSEILQFVIYLGNGPVQMRRRIQRPKLDYSYEIVDMKSLAPAVFLGSPSDAERVLALLCESPDPRETLRRVLVSWRHLSERELAENVDRLRVLSKLRGIEIMAEEELQRMPFDIDIDMSYSPVFKKGEERGVERGEAAGMAKVLTLVLEHRFGVLPEPFRQRLVSASRKQLEDWAIRSADVETLEGLFAS